MKLLGVSLGEGTTKVGEVMTFSLPSKTTCPGASTWCLRRCYAWRYEQRRPGCRRANESHLALANDTQRFAETFIGILPRILPCFRIHVSGDFHTVEYIEAWTLICRAFPQTLFWGYTRSWTVPALREALEHLRAEPNIQLFASVDPDMDLPPREWRRAYVNTDARAVGIACGKQIGEHGSCLACGLCFRRRWGDVVFKVH